MNEMVNEKATEHKVNDYVIYRKDGICKITDIRNENFGDMGQNLYYVMRTVYDENSIIYVPVDCKDLDQNMRHILSVDEINTIIEESIESENTWVDDNKARTNVFNQILNRGDRAEILWLVKVLSTHKRNLEEQKKKLSVSDTKILTSAQKLITEEFSFVLEIPQNEVIPYIIDKIEQLQKSDEDLCLEKDGA